MKLRTYTGLDKETTCACGCNQKILARPDIQVVVDMESYPRKRYLPGHAGNGYGSAPYARKEKKEEAKPAPSPAPTPPTPAVPSPTSPQPQVEPTPVPTPKVVTGTAPSLADNRPWKILQVTIGLGDYSSIKAGVADFARDDETPTQLGARLVAELTSDIKTELDVVHQVQQGKPLSVAAQGAACAPQTFSPAPAGAPPTSTTSVRPLPSCSMANALENHYTTQKSSCREEILEMRRTVDLELLDISVNRRAKKETEVNRWLLRQGYESLVEAAEDYPCVESVEAFRELVTSLEAVNSTY
jgi:hypothetical protein